MSVLGLAMLVVLAHPGAASDLLKSVSRDLNRLSAHDFKPWERGTNDSLQSPQVRRRTFVRVESATHRGIQFLKFGGWVYGKKPPSEIEVQSRYRLRWRDIKSLHVGPLDRAKTAYGLGFTLHKGRAARLSDVTPDRKDFVSTDVEVFFLHMSSHAAAVELAQSLQRAVNRFGKPAVTKPVHRA